MSNDNNENVIGFPSRDGNSMPADRTGMTRQQIRAMQRQEEKDQKKMIQKQEDLRKILDKPVTKKEFQKAMFNVFGSLEKVVAEFRKLAVRNEATQALLAEKGIITKEEYEAVAQAHHEWNMKIDEIVNMYGVTPITEIVKVVADWNNTHNIKIGWQHIDLAPRLLADETMVLEEKLQVAADLEMPQPFIDELRKQSNAEFAEEAVAEFEKGLNESLKSPADALAAAEDELSKS